MKKFFKKHQRT